MAVSSPSAPPSASGLPCVNDFRATMIQYTTGLGASEFHVQFGAIFSGWAATGNWGLRGRGGSRVETLC